VFGRHDPHRKTACKTEETEAEARHMGVAVHISNRYLNLRPVVEGLAHEFGLGVVTIVDGDPKDWWLYRSTWVLVSSNRGLLTNPRLIEAADIAANQDQPEVIWTDDHASVFEILK
jgi:hypothetical protein